MPRKSKLPIVRSRFPSEKEKNGIWHQLRKASEEARRAQDEYFSRLDGKEIPTKKKASPRKPKGEDAASCVVA